MADGPVYLRRDGELYKCEIPPDQPEGGGKTYDCTQVLTCEGGDVEKGPSCQFTDKPMTEYAIRQNPDGEIEVVASVYNMVDGKLGAMPPSRGIEMKSGAVKGIPAANLEQYLSGWGVSYGDAPPAARRIADGPRGSSRILSGMMLSVDDQVVPVLTVPAAGTSSGPTALALSRWAEQKAAGSPLVNTSTAVAIFYTKAMEKRAQDLALEYVKRGSYVDLYQVNDAIYRLTPASDGTVDAQLDEEFMRERARTLTVAFLPTEGKDVPPLDPGDPATMMALNNERIDSVRAKTGVGDLGSLYDQYIIALGRQLGGIKTFEMDPERV